MSKLDELEKLAKLKEKGILTEEEFQTAKAMALDSSGAEFMHSNKSSHKNKPLEKVTDGFVWTAIIGLFILSLIFDPMLQMGEIGFGPYFLIFFIFNSILFGLDDAQIQKAYKTKSNVWYLFFVPVYLWKRSNIVEDNKVLFWAWIISAVLSGLV